MRVKSPGQYPMYFESSLLLDSLSLIKSNLFWRKGNDAASQFLKAIQDQNKPQAPTRSQTTQPHKAIIGHKRLL